MHTIQYLYTKNIIYIYIKHQGSQNRTMSNAIFMGNNNDLLLLKINSCFLLNR